MAFTATHRCIVRSVGLALVGLALSGCGSKDGERQAKIGSATDPRLVGKWKLQDGNFKGTVAEFTSGGKVLVNLHHKWMPSEDIVGSYSATGGTLDIVTGHGVLEDHVKIEVEYQATDAIVMVVKDGHAFGFDGFSGRWQRVNDPAGKMDGSLSPKVTDPPALADAKKRFRSFEQKRAMIEPLLEKALADRDELVRRLREAGVNSPADLKGNLRGQKLAESVQKVSAEIEGLERQIGTLDSALLDAKALIRRLEREQAGIPDDETRKLAEQLKEVEERTDGTPLPVTPLDVDAAVEKALKGSTTSKKSK